MKKLSSLTIFFPFLNDEGTVLEMINNAYTYGKQFTNDLEVIAIKGGQSKDLTNKKISEAKKIHPNLKIIDRTTNTEGYAVIKHGFWNATKEWVFYTDGDAQYHLENDLIKLIEKQEKTNADVVNGYKRKRGDNIVRIFLGRVYKRLSKYLFSLKVRDVDCDFRLIRTSFLKKIKLESTDASILPELIKKLELAGAKFAEVPVAHYPRVWGKSNYTPMGLLKEKLIGDLKLYFKMKRIQSYE